MMMDGEISLSHRPVRPSYVKRGERRDRREEAEKAPLRPPGSGLWHGLLLSFIH